LARCSTCCTRAAPRSLLPRYRTCPAVAPTHARRKTKTPQRQGMTGKQTHSVSRPVAVIKARAASGIC
jgi:hypothetical protein